MQAGDDRSMFLSTLPATRRDRALAFAVVGVSSVLCACAALFARVPLTPVPAFVASYQSALAINDLITAILLYSQFSLLRSQALLLLAQRIPVYRGRGNRPCLDLSRSVCAGRAFRRRTADNSLALPSLARRIPSSGTRLCAAERQGWRRQNTGIGQQSDPGERHCGRRCDISRGLDRHRRT
jgi:hypothetical protein